MGDAPEIDGNVIIENPLDIKVGELYQVKIVDAMEYDLVGELFD
jgi:ribosomal protein S12 methylthiotransferase